MKKIAIIGSGPSALALAAHLDPSRYQVSIYERNTAPARKFLVAGDGGFNLTHSEPMEQFIMRYTPSTFLHPALEHFTNKDLCDWLNSIGIPTRTGTSKRIFPEEGIKPIDVLNAILEHLRSKKVALHTGFHWKGWNEKGELLFDHKGNIETIAADIVVFALGGASWSKTGSDGNWITYFREKGVPVIPFRPSNCSFKIDWPAAFIAHATGKALKNVLFSCSGKEKLGEAVITGSGIEGSGVYALSPQIRTELDNNGTALLHLDLKPGSTKEGIITRLRTDHKGSNLTRRLEELVKLERIQVQLLKAFTTKEDFNDPGKLAQKIKDLALPVTGLGPLDEAISTVGGLPLEEVDPYYQLMKLPNHYAIGEMLDWDAPTGGYLLQACFSMGAFLAAHLNTD